MNRFALVCAVDLEIRPLLERMRDVSRDVIGGRPAYTGTLDDREVIVLTSGMGKSNAAQGLTALLERIPVRGILGFGVGGAYLNAGLSVGEIAIASSQHYGDEGVETPTGWMSVEGIGIPLVVADDAPLYNDFSVDDAALPAIRAALGDPVAGPFVTVSTCSGTRARGEALAARFGAVCETMEGAAYAHIATHYRLPYCEVRGISNLVDDRDLSLWRLETAAAAAAAAAATIVNVWEPGATSRRSIA